MANTTFTVLTTKNVPVDLSSTELLKFTKGIAIGSETLVDASGNIPYGRISASEGFQSVLTRIGDVEDVIGDSDTNGTIIKRLDTLEAYKTAIGDLSTANTVLYNLDTRITANAGDITTLSGTVSGHTTAIGAINTAIGDASNPASGTILYRIAEIEESIGASGDIATRLTAVEGKADTNETAIGTINTALGDASNPAAGTIRKRLADAETDIDNLQADLDTASTGLKARMTAAETAIGTNAGDISAINSAIGADDTTGLRKRIKDIEDVVPSAATSSNQLADKAFVNSSIQTATAFFDGNWATLADVPSTLAGFTERAGGALPAPGPNNYLVVIADESHSNQTWRYKYTGSAIATAETYNKNLWVAEYKVNDTALTQAQLDALNSGITSTLVGKITTNETNIGTINTALGDTTNPASGTIRERIATAESDIDTLESDLNTASTGLKARMSAAETAIGTNADAISAINTAIGADDTTGLRKRIADIETAIGDDNTAASVKGRIKAIEDMVPSAASSSNELADKAYVGTAVGAVQTNLDNINFLNLPATFAVGNRRYQLTIDDNDNMVMTRLADVSNS